MVTRAGLLMVLVVVGLGLVAQWAYSTGRTWLVIVAGVAAVAVVIVLNHAGSRPRRPPRERP